MSVEQYIHEQLSLPTVSEIGIPFAVTAGILTIRSLIKDAKALAKNPERVAIASGFDEGLMGELAQEKDEKTGVEGGEQLKNPLVGLAKETDTDKPVAANLFETNRRLSMKRWVTAGGFALGSVAFLQPTVHSPVPQEATVGVIESSSAMGTQDISSGTNEITRFDAAVGGFENVSGNLAIVQFADNIETTLTLGPNSKSRVDSLRIGGSGSNLIEENGGGSVSQALVEAAGHLSASPNGSSERIILVSDGYVNDDVSDIQPEVARLKREGIDVEVVMPGTSSNSTAQYFYKGAGPYYTPETPSIVAGYDQAFGSKNVFVSSSASTIAADIKKAEGKVDGNQTSEEMILPPVIAAGVIIAGYRKWNKRFRNVPMPGNG